MNRLIPLLPGLLLMTGAAGAQDIDRVNGTLITLNPNGAWSWIQDERVMVVNGKILFGSVASQTQGNLPIANFVRHPGDIIATTFDPATGKRSHFELHDRLEYDDHNAPAFLRRPDGRILGLRPQQTTDSLSITATDTAKRWSCPTDRSSLAILPPAGTAPQTRRTTPFAAFGFVCGRTIPASISCRHRTGDTQFDSVSI